MLTIKPIKEPSLEDNQLIFTIVDGEEELGRLRAAVTPEKAVITELFCQPGLVDGLCRAALAYCDNRGVETAEFTISDKEILRDLGYHDGMQIKNFFARKNCL